MDEEGADVCQVIAKIVEKCYSVLNKANQLDITTIIIIQARALQDLSISETS